MGVINNECEMVDASFMSNLKEDLKSHTTRIRQDRLSTLSHPLPMIHTLTWQTVLTACLSARARP